MAASSKSEKIGGYVCEFVQPVSEELQCALCRHIARDPHLTSCCGEHFCQVCITPVLEDKKPCPSCEQTEFTVLLNKRDQKKILALEVRCAMKDRGCEWAGKLEDLEAHLDVTTGDCEYVDVECTNKCDQPVAKYNLPTHLSSFCSKREYTCQYCNFKATYEIVSNDHWPQCSFYPVPCPNACGIQAIERGDLEAHLLQCPLEEAECDFNHAGCNTKLPRQDLERHMEESVQKHMALISAMSLRSSRVFEEKLQEQQQKFEQKFQEQEQKLKVQGDEFSELLRVKDQEIRELGDQLVLRERAVQEQLQEKEEEIRQVREQLQQEIDKKVQETESSLRKTLTEKKLFLLTIPPFKFTMENFNTNDDGKNWWSSPPLYTHIGGYKFGIQIFIGKEDLLIQFVSRGAEFDDQLKWPAKLTITMWLFNQYQPKSHYKTIHKITLPEPIGYYPSSTYISKADLEWNSNKQTQYLKNNQLQFQVTKVTVG